MLNFWGLNRKVSVIRWKNRSASAGARRFKTRNLELRG